MTLKKFKIISVFLIFGLCGLFHFGYSLFPNFFTSLIFPVNESIWEHNKIIIASFLTMSILEKIYYKKQKNTIYAGCISSIICCLIVMLIFTPIYLYILNAKENMIVAFSILFLAISISEYLNYQLLKEPYDEFKERYGALLFACLIVLNAILTYNPIHWKLFYDFNKKKYGI